jgi:hypothetical protein
MKLQYLAVSVDVCIVVGVLWVFLTETIHTIDSWQFWCMTLFMIVMLGIKTVVDFRYAKIIIENMFKL